MMSKSIVAAACALLIAMMSACADKTTSDVRAMNRYTIEHGGLEREYFVFFPSSHDNGAMHPVAIFMHGTGPGSGCLAVSANVRVLRQAPGRLIVAPSLRRSLMQPSLLRVTTWSQRMST